MQLKNSFMTYLLIAIVFILFIVLSVQLVRVGELLSRIKGQDPNEVTDKDNNTQGILFLVVGFGFIAFVIWQMIAWDHLLLPPAASEHGQEIDTLMTASMALILVVFFVLTPMLFIFAYKYRGKKGNKAYFFSHNNKLEVIWTVIPTIILTGFIIYGLKTWDKAMNIKVTPETKVIEIYGQGLGKFGWTARYAGEDNILGDANYKLVDSDNVLGVNMNDKNSYDDKVTRKVHLVVGQPVLLKFRSQDVIHSAYLPHFRVQMNCVPGIVTQFGFTPTKTTKQMQKEEGPDFKYVLLCNKICGAGHWNMQMEFVVQTQEEFDEWYASQKTLEDKLLSQEDEQLITQK